MQHRLSYIRIENFRSCRGVKLPLDSYTPLVGQNNSGKSTILEAIRWLIKPSALTAQDYSDPAKPIVISGLIEGLTEKILERVPDKKHRAAFAPCCPDGVLWIRVSVLPGKPKDFKQEIWDHEKTKPGDFPGVARLHDGHSSSGKCHLPGPAGDPGHERRCKGLHEHDRRHQHQIAD